MKLLSLSSSKGASSVDHLLAITLIAILCVVAIQALAPRISEKFVYIGYQTSGSSSGAFSVAGWGGGSSEQSGVGSSGTIGCSHCGGHVGSDPLGEGVEGGDTSVSSGKGF